MYGRLALIFNDDEEIKCGFHTIVVKIEVLNAKYPGGLRAFVEKHNARCNRKLAVICGMGTEALDDAIMDIESNGLVCKEDFAYFDAAEEAMSYEIAKRTGVKADREIEFTIDWLKGYAHNGYVMACYSN